MTDTDDAPTETDEDDILHLERLEAFMLERGWRRHREHGFWVAPDVAGATQEVEEEGEDDDEA